MLTNRMPDCRVESSTILQCRRGGRIFHVGGQQSAGRSQWRRKVDSVAGGQARTNETFVSAGTKCSQCFCWFKRIFVNAIRNKHLQLVDICNKSERFLNGFTVRPLICDDNTLSDSNI